MGALALVSGLRTELLPPSPPGWRKRGRASQRPRQLFDSDLLQKDLAAARRSLHGAPFIKAGFRPVLVALRRETQGNIDVKKTIDGNLLPVK